MSAGNPLPALPAPFRPVKGGVVLFVRLTPKAVSNSIEGCIHEDRAALVAARVRAVPENGKANEALIRLVAGWLGLAPSSLSINAGDRSRLKQVLITGDAETLGRNLCQKLDALHRAQQPE